MPKHMWDFILMATIVGQSASLHPTSNAPLTQSASPVPIRRPTPEELMLSKRWVEEHKRTAFARFDRVAGHSEPPVPESGILEYRRNLEYLIDLLTKIEQYVHVAHATLKKEDVVRRMFTMMSVTNFQLDEMHKPNPQYILELQTIQGMTREAVDMDKGLKAILGLGAEGRVLLF
ncbi:hypothetical protein BJV78DRAFT_1256099 [Lactifluus subvellereus]|nr:hypothetical protein BJV78DRAFT_1256099 [Lactifluus subvellereus]